MGFAVDRSSFEAESPRRMSGASRLIEVDPAGVTEPCSFCLNHSSEWGHPISRASSSSVTISLAAAPWRSDLVDQELEQEIAVRVELSGLERPDDSKRMPREQIRLSTGKTFAAHFAALRHAATP